jgi:carboxylesterase type B
MVYGKHCNDNVQCFFGVPYAEPPTGDNRFRPPVVWADEEDAISAKE